MKNVLITSARLQTVQNPTVIKNLSHRTLLGSVDYSLNDTDYPRKTQCSREMSSIMVQKLSRSEGR